MSEYNHRLAGAFLVLIGLVALVGNLSSSGRFSFAGKFWPLFFLLPGIFLIFQSDAEVWPLGPQSWLYMLQHNLQATQHKGFAIIMISIGILEFRRAQGKLSKAAATWAFPVIAALGASMLFFHPHEATPETKLSTLTVAALPAAHDHAAMEHDHAAMSEKPNAAPANSTTPDPHAGHDMDAADSHASHEGHAGHEKVKLQHLWFSLTGFGIAFFKLLYDGQFVKKRYFGALWPICMSALGMLLVFYAE